ncbi:MAG TPA: hypothetical protein DCE07_02570 [Peptococcaceae bacterium]|nr:hypothetical protein [Peptococcaceae bacterium]
MSMKKKAIGIVGILILGVCFLGTSYCLDKGGGCWELEDLDLSLEPGRYALFHIERLASDFYEGRAPGSAGCGRAARYLARQFQLLGLKPAGDQGTYFQRVKVPSFVLVKQGERWKPKINSDGFVLSDNVLAFLGPGEFPSQKGVVIVSAHYDHLGVSGNAWFPGANDNASGLAVLLETACFFAGQPRMPNLQILFAAWTGEEEGLYGSRHFVATFPLKKIKAVINLDTLGNGEPAEFLVWSHDRDNQLISLVEATGKRLDYQVKVQFLGTSSAYTSDDQPFSENGVPAVTLLSQTWLEHNHTIEDTPEMINPGKLENATKLVINIVKQLAY